MGEAILARNASGGGGGRKSVYKFTSIIRNSESLLYLDYDKTALASVLDPTKLYFLEIVVPSAYVNSTWGGHATIGAFFYYDDTAEYDILKIGSNAATADIVRADGYRVSTNVTAQTAYNEARLIFQNTATNVFRFPSPADTEYSVNLYEN